jgi:hypothetical protein
VSDWLGGWHVLTVLHHMTCLHNHYWPGNGAGAEMTVPVFLCRGASTYLHSHLTCPRSVIIGLAVSYIGNIGDHNMRLVGPLPAGLPSCTISWWAPMDGE